MGCTYRTPPPRVSKHIFPHHYIPQIGPYVPDNRSKRLAGTDTTRFWSCGRAGYAAFHLIKKFVANNGLGQFAYAASQKVDFLLGVKEMDGRPDARRVIHLAHD